VETPQRVVATTATAATVATAVETPQLGVSTPSPASAASPTPALPAQTIAADTIAALQPLRTVGVGRAVAAALSQDGTLVAVATTAGVALLELPGARLAQFYPLPGGVDAVLLSPDATRMGLRRVSSEAVELRSVADGALLASAPGSSMAFSPDGALFAGGPNTGIEPPEYAKLWRSEDGQEIAELPGDDARFSPDGATIATRALGDGNLATWLHRSDGSEIGFVNGSDARFSPDGSLVAVTVFPLDGSTPQTGVYRVADAAPAFGVDGSLPTFSPDGALLAVAQGREAALYDARDGAAHGALKPDAPDPNIYGETNVIALAFGSDSTTLRAAAGGDLYVWHVGEGLLLAQANGAAQRGGQPDATFSPDGEALISRNVVGDADCGLYTGLRVLRADGGELAADAQGVAAQFSADGKLAVIVSSLGVVRVLPLDDIGNDVVASLPGYGAIAFSPEGATLAASQVRSSLNPFGPSAVELFDVAGGALTASLEVASYVGEPTSLRFGPGSAALFAEEESGCDFVYSVRETAWELPAGGEGRTIWEAPVVSDIPQPQAASIRAFSPLSGVGAWADADGVVRVAKDGVTTTLELPSPATALALSPDGATLAVGDAAGALALLSAQGGEARGPRSAPSSAPNQAVTRLAFSPDGTLVAARHSDGQVRVWGAPGEPPIATLATASDVGPLLVTPDNALLISVGPEGVAFYSLADGRELRTLDVVASQVAMGPGRRLLAVLSDERVTLWGVP
jgi:WD40 repeat protein